MLWLVAAIGCSGAGTPSFRPTTAPAGTPFSSLSPDQVQQLCVEQLEYAATLERSAAGREALCGAIGRGAALQAINNADPAAPPTDADLRQACMLAHDACLAKPPAIPDPGPDAPVCVRSATTVILTDCAGTVGEYAACVTADLAPELAQPVPACATVTVAMFAGPAPSDGGTRAPPPACQAFWAKCLALDGAFLGTGI
jgi:hypothetical protein